MESPFPRYKEYKHRVHTQSVLLLVLHGAVWDPEECENSRIFETRVSKYSGLQTRREREST